MGDEQEERGRALIDWGSGFVDVGTVSSDGLRAAADDELDKPMVWPAGQSVTVTVPASSPLPRWLVDLVEGTYRLPPQPLYVNSMVAAMLPPELIESGLVAVYPDHDPVRPPAVDLRRAGEEARRSIELDAIPPHLLSRYLT